MKIFHLNYCTPDPIPIGESQSALMMKGGGVMRSETMDRSSVSNDQTYRERPWPMVIRPEPQIPSHHRRSNTNGRTVSPPISELSRLRTPLTRGEKWFLKVLLDNLPLKWEIYIQPHLNGLRPDFVLLNPDVGIAVFEVKDWNLNAYFVDRRGPKGRPRLMSRKNGEFFSVRNPVEQIRSYKDEIFDLYCPTIDEKAGYALITAGLVFPFAETPALKRMFGQFRELHKMNEAPRYYPLVGGDALRSEAIARIFPESRRTTSKHMTSEIAADLRAWLVEPDFSAEQRRPLPMDREQKRLVLTRTSSGFRKIKGPAGSGKSLVLAARAAQLSAEGKNVLVVSYNITLTNYLKDLAVRWRPPQGNPTLSNVTFLNFHHWCKRVCFESGNGYAYQDMWPDVGFPDDGFSAAKKKKPALNRILNTTMPNLVQKILSGPDAHMATQYDAILVDEGQDYRLNWWNTLRMALKPGGEMILAVDKTQDVYETARDWTDERMAGSGLVGAWVRLPVSYRMPEPMVMIAARFAHDYLPKDLVDLPRFHADQQELFTMLRWIQVPEKGNPTEILRDELLRLVQSDAPQRPPMADLIFLTPCQESGMWVVEALQDKGIKVIHTFSKDRWKSQDLKRNFFKGSGRLKATTLHSFKGWEGRSIVLYTGTAWTKSTRALLYSGLTRLKKSVAGSLMTVVCPIDGLADFGATWPAFHDLRNGRRAQ